MISEIGMSQAHVNFIRQQGFTDASARVQCADVRHKRNERGRRMTCEAES